MVCAGSCPSTASRITDRRDIEVSLDTEEGLQQKGHQLAKQLAAMVARCGALQEQNQLLSQARVRAQVVAEEEASPPPELEAEARIAKFEAEELRQQIRSARSSAKEAAVSTPSTLAVYPLSYSRNPGVQWRISHGWVAAAARSRQGTAEGPEGEAQETRGPNHGARPGNS